MRKSSACFDNRSSNNPTTLTLNPFFLKKKIFTVEDFITIKELGAGKYGQVLLAR